MRHPTREVVRLGHALGISGALTVLVMATIYADGGFFYYYVSYNHDASIHLRCLRESIGNQDAHTIFLNANSWHLSIPGLTTVGACGGTTSGCAYASDNGKAVNHSLLYSLHGLPNLIQLRYNTLKGFLYAETLFLDCYWGAANADGFTMNDAQVKVVFFAHSIGDGQIGRYRRIRSFVKRYTNHHFQGRFLTDSSRATRRY